MNNDKRDWPVYRVKVNGNPYEIQSRFACDAIEEAININREMTGKWPVYLIYAKKVSKCLR